MNLLGSLAGSLLGIHLSLLLGEKKPERASAFIVENLRSIEVTQPEDGPSGFQMTFHIGRSSVIDLSDYRLLKRRELMPMSRVIIKVRVPVKPQTIMHGVITDHQFNPSNEPGASTLTVTGEDISLLMDLEQSNTPFPSQSDYDIVTQIVRKYGELGLELPSDGPPTEPRASNQPNPKEELQQSTVMATDRSFLQELAERYGFLFQVTPTAQGASRVHWGPPQRSTREQDPLLVNMGPSSNVESISFHNDAMRAEKVAFNQNQRRTTINEPGESRNIPFAQKRAEARRTVALTCGDPSRIKAIAQGKVDRASDRVITATGELDVLRYNKLLEPRRPVNVFGVGRAYDGLYYVASVTHKITRGSYTQSFTLTKEGVNS